MRLVLLAGTLFEQCRGDRVEFALDGVVGAPFGVLEQRQQYQGHGGHGVAGHVLPADAQPGHVHTDECDNQQQTEPEERRRAGEVGRRLGEAREEAAACAAPLDRMPQAHA